MCSREMKDSGIEWIGYVPNEWYLEKLKNLYSFEKGKNAALYTQEYIGTHKGEYPVYSGQTENDGIMGNIDTYDYEENECLFTTTVGAKVMTPRVIKGKFSLSQNCLIMKSNNNSSIKFIYYMLNPLFNYEKSLIPAYMQPSLRVSDLRRYQFYVPNIEEQQQIVNYLDKKVSQIDDIISNQKSLIKKYKAYKQSLITETVTKGLNKNVPMKDSGIEWIGKIPSHWNVKKMKNVVDIIMGQSPNSDDIKDNGNILFMQGNVEFGEKYPNPSIYCDKCNKHSRIGDILMSVRAPIGALNFADKQYGIGRGLCSIGVKDELSINYLWYYLQKSKKDFNYYSNGSTFDAITITILNNFYIVVPNLKEQQEITDFLDKKCNVIDSVICKKEHLIEKLESYKKSLIYECITGKRAVN